MVSGDVKANLTKVRAFNCNVFDGVDDYIDVAHDNRQLGASLLNGFTLSAWINMKSVGEGAVGDYGQIVSKATNTTSLAGFRMNVMEATTSATKYRVRTRLNSGAASGTSADDSLTFGIWTHILLTISSAQISRWYINGVISGSPTDLLQPISTITSTNALRIGNVAAATTRTVNGAVRDVKMWNRVLTAAEIAEDYAGTTPMSGLLHWFKLGGDYADYGLVGVTATNSGSVPSVVDDALAAVVKAQRVASTDKWMIYRGMGGQVGTVNIE